MMRKSKRGWIKIVEAFTAVLLVTGVLLIIVNQGYIGKKDVSAQIYDAQISILREIQQDDSLRRDILIINSWFLPVEWGDVTFPQSVKDKIIQRTPSHLECKAKICATNSVCDFTGEEDKDIYAKSIIITAVLGTYDPRQLKLFCWVR